MLRKLACLSLLALANSGCHLTIKEGTACAPAGKLSNGGICAHLISPATSDLTFNEILDLLEAHEERTCVPVTGLPICKEDQSIGVPIRIPARGAAIVMTPQDWGQMKTELEQACRMLGKNCSFAKP